MESRGFDARPLTQEEVTFLQKQLRKRALPPSVSMALGVGFFFLMGTLSIWVGQHLGWSVGALSLIVCALMLWDHVEMERRIECLERDQVGGEKVVLKEVIAKKRKFPRLNKPRYFFRIGNEDIRVSREDYKRFREGDPVLLHLTPHAHFVLHVEGAANEVSNMRREVVA
ncbi:MAG: hypothetical protein AAGJ35_15050 [Myxococcota bacterium]